MDFFVLTAAQRTAAMAFDNEDVRIGARAIDNTTPGVGLNLNPDAVGVAAGAVVTLVGKYVATKRIVDDEAYLTYAPGMVTLLLTLPWASLEPETIFAPVEPV
jgi:hypothetical protein